MYWNRRISGFLSRGMLLAAAAGAHVFAAEPVQSSQVDAAIVSALLKRVESDRIADRTAAAKELQSLGPGVLPHLPSPDRMDTAAARDVVIQVRNVLERQQAKDSTRASTVTLSRTASRAELLVAVTEQTGNRVTILKDEAPSSLTVNWQSRPFWEAIDDVLAESDKRVSWNPTAGSFVIDSRPVEQKEHCVAHAGTFRVEAVVDRIKLAATDDHAAVVRVLTTWQAEPRLRPLFLRVKAAEWQGTTGSNNVTSWNPEAEYELPFVDDTRQLSWPLDLVWPEAKKGKAWSLQGRAVVHLAAMTETILFDSVALRPNVQRRRGGVAVRIRKAEFRPGEDGRLQATIRIQVSYDTGGPAFESHRAGVFYQGGSLQGPTGKPIPFTDMEATQEADGAIGVEYRFRDLPGRGSDFQFRYEAPTLFLDVPLDVDIPRLSAPE